MSCPSHYSNPLKSTKFSSWSARLFYAACAVSIGDVFVGVSAFTTPLPDASPVDRLQTCHHHPTTTSYRWRFLSRKDRASIALSFADGGASTDNESTDDHHVLDFDFQRMQSTSDETTSAEPSDTRQPELSESDAIRILRAFPRYSNKHGNTSDGIPDVLTMQACHTAMDVLHVLSQSSSMTSSTGDINSGSEIEDIVEAVAPNIASAALRRLLSPPFLSASFSAPKKSVQYSTQQQCTKHHHATSDTERYTYEQLTTTLLKKLTACMEEQRKDLSSWLFFRSDDEASALLSQKDTFASPPVASSGGDSSALNWYALADLLYSTSALSNLLSQEMHHKNSKNEYLQTLLETQDDDAATLHLFDSTVQYLSWSNDITSSFVRCIGQRRLVRDVITPIVLIESVRRQTDSHSDNSWDVLARNGEPLDSLLDEIPDYENDDVGEYEVWRGRFGLDRNTNYNHLLGVASSFLSLPHSLEVLDAPELSTTLWSLAQIYNPSHQIMQLKRRTLQQPQRLLMRAFMKRLRKYSVKSSACGSVLVQAIWSADRLIHLLKQQDETSIQPFLDVGLRSGEYGVLRELSFPGESTINICDATLAYETPQHGNSLPSVLTDVLREEAVTMFHTLTNEIVLPPRIFTSDTTSSAERQRSKTGEIKLHSLSLGQAADILHAAVSLNISTANITIAINEIITYASSMSHGALRECNSSKDIARLLWSLQRLRVGEGRYNNEGRCVQLLGERFLALVNHRKRNSHRISTKTLVTILRSGVLMYSGESIATKAILEAASLLILDFDDEDSNAGEESELAPFLSRCNEFEVSNLLFAYAMAKRFDKGEYDYADDILVWINKDLIIFLCFNRHMPNLLIKMSSCF
jgi:hypothetical protein|eukprot:scaffold1540_cov194-Alexandrium_tamarense.AAC.16